MKKVRKHCLLLLSVNGTVLKLLSLNQGATLIVLFSCSQSDPTVSSVVTTFKIIFSVHFFPSPMLYWIKPPPSLTWTTAKNSYLGFQFLCSLPIFNSFLTWQPVYPVESSIRSCYVSPTLYTLQVFQWPFKIQTPSYGLQGPNNMVSPSSPASPLLPSHPHLLWPISLKNNSRAKVKVKRRYQANNQMENLEFREHVNWNYNLGFQQKVTRLGEITKEERLQRGGPKTGQQSILNISRSGRWKETCEGFREAAASSCRRKKQEVWDPWNHSEKSGKNTHFQNYPLDFSVRR